ncbi:efflux RND transporter periplasmic adaptor subunit [Glaesserella sp.]|uniref:efflux RND transporter periplasmic adaptor subunit n=1 Tax=Glaesserella sp. TaxID=2094731 RepID=UPI0035A09F8F
MKSLKYMLVVLIFGGLFFYFFVEEEKNNDITFPVVKGRVQKNVIASGILQASEQVDIGAQVSGQIKSILVKEGQSVKKGDLLAVIDPRLAETELKLAKAELENTEANLQAKYIHLKQLQSDWVRHYKLNQTNSTAKKEVEEAKSRLEIAKTEIRMAQSNLTSAKIRVEKAETELGYTEIRSPLDAVVISVIAQSGQTLATTQQVPVLMRLANIDTMKVNAKISEADVVHVAAGAPVTFTLLGEPAKPFHTHIDAVKLAPVHISEPSESSSGAIYYHAMFNVPNPQHKLRISMTAAVTIMLDKREDVLTIPLSALGKMISPDTYYVTVLHKNGKKEQIEVKTGLKDDVNVEIVEGLVEGDTVVLSGGSVPFNEEQYNITL